MVVMHHNFEHNSEYWIQQSTPSNLGEAIDSREYNKFKRRRVRCIFLRDLPFHFRDEELLAVIVGLLGGDGQLVEKCRVKYSEESNKTLQVGLVMLRTQGAANDLLQRLQENPRHGGRDIK